MKQASITLSAFLNINVRTLYAIIFSYTGQQLTGSIERL